MDHHQARPCTEGEGGIIRSPPGAEDDNDRGGGVGAERERPCWLEWFALVAAGGRDSSRSSDDRDQVVGYKDGVHPVR